jgi:SCY1-like protein 1
VHGCIRCSSVFTSESGEWKLGGLDILSSVKEDDAVIYVRDQRSVICSLFADISLKTNAWLAPDVKRYAAPEVQKSGWEAIKRNPLPAIDSYGLGLLVFEVFNGGSFTPDQVGQTKNVPPSMHQSYKRLLNANPKARLSASHFLEQGRRSGGFFETPLIRLSQGVENFGLKDDAEKAEILR